MGSRLQGASVCFGHCGVPGSLGSVHGFSTFGGSGGDLLEAGVEGNFPARSTYLAFFLGRELMLAAAELWSSWAPLDVKISVWLVLKDRLWTADRLARRLMPHPASCPLCDQVQEDVQHMLLSCPFFRSIWVEVLLRERLHRFTPGDEGHKARNSLIITTFSP